MTQVALLAGHQSRIYLEGLGGRLPELPLSYEELERRAERQLTRGAYGYVAGGAGAEDTMRANREAFRRRPSSAGASSPACSATSAAAT
jgi:hypothetical protein